MRNPGLWASLALVFLFGSTESAIVSVEAGKKVCLQERFSGYALAYGEVEVLEGPDKKIFFTVTGLRSGDVAPLLKEEVNGLLDYSWRVPSNDAGRLFYCFRNDAEGEKLVRFSIHVTEPFGEKELHQTKRGLIEDAEIEHFESLQSKINELEALVQAAKRDTDDSIAREVTHRNTIESTNARVLYWSLLEATVLLICTASQVWSFRRLFKNRLADSV